MDNKYSDSNPEVVAYDEASTAQEQQEHLIASPEQVVEREPGSPVNETDAAIDEEASGHPGDVYQRSATSDDDSAPSDAERSDLSILEPASPDDEAAPASPGDEGTPASPDEEAAPASHDEEAAPASHDEEAAPDSPDDEAAPASPDAEEAPVSPGAEEMPVSPVDKAAPASPDAKADEQVSLSDNADDPVSPDNKDVAGPASPVMEEEPPASPGINVPTASEPQPDDSNLNDGEDDMQISDAEDADPAAAAADIVESVVEIAVEGQEESVEERAEEETQESRKRRRLSPSPSPSGGDANADADGESDFEGFEPPEAKQPRRQRRQQAEGGSDDDGEDRDLQQREPQQSGSGIIADIFGESDQEDDEGAVGGAGVGVEEEFEGFNAAEAEAAARGGGGDDDEEEGDDSTSSSGEGEGEGADDGEDQQPAGFPVSDFDAIMEQKKSERRHSRKRSSARSELLTDADSVITQVVYEMLEAAQSDKELMKSGRPATKKMKMLPKVISLLTKADVIASLGDSAMLSAITEWLAPCPDGSLPSLQIRETLLRMLETVPGIDADGLASSGLGKAVMYLYKSKRESRSNKAICGRLINSWSRPIFQLTANYSTLTKEEREERDYANIPQHKRSTSDQRTPGRGDGSSGGKPKMGEPGYVGRARVPMPSNKDYVVRPKPKFDVDAKIATAGPKKKERQIWFERHVRQLKEKRRSGKSVKKAVPMSIEGRKMAL